MQVLRSFFKVILAILLIVVLVVGAGTFALSRLAFPRTNGEAILENAGLDGPVDIYRDENGVPHIYAETTHDLFLAQGYVHAQDRFWQMDFQRAVGHGRVAQLLGESQVDADTFLRTLDGRGPPMKSSPRCHRRLRMRSPPTRPGSMPIWKSGPHPTGSRIRGPQADQCLLQAATLGTGRHPGVGQSHGLGSPQQHGRRNRPRRDLQ